MVPAAAPKRAASLCLALLPLAAGHAHPHAHDHALLLLGEGQPIDGLQSELFAPWRSDACHDPTEWCWTGADGAASVDLTYEEDDDEARRRSARAAANKKLLSRTSADEDGEVV